MSPTRATRSKDGVRRLDLRVPVRLDLDSMATAVAPYADPDEIAAAGLRRLLGWARDGVGAHGLDHIFMGDTEGMEVEIEAARSRLVDLGVFPPTTASESR
jgi:hypothetical protein